MNEKIFKNWKQYLLKEEEKVRELKVFMAHCTLTYGVTRTQQDILTDIRAIEGVTILTLVEPAIKLENQESLKIKLKFTTRGADLKQYIMRLKRSIAALDDVYSLRILHVTKI
jgi:adenine specific DNA methylase Mod